MGYFHKPEPLVSHSLSAYTPLRLPCTGRAVARFHRACKAYRFSFGFCPGGCGAGLEKAVLLLTGTELFLELATCTGWAVDDLGLLLLIFLSSISSDLQPADRFLILRKEGKRGTETSHCTSTGLQSLQGRAVAYFSKRDPTAGRRSSRGRTPPPKLRAGRI